MHRFFRQYYIVPKKAYVNAEDAETFQVSLDARRMNHGETPMPIIRISPSHSIAYLQFRTS